MALSKWGNILIGAFTRFFFMVHFLSWMCRDHLVCCVAATSANADILPLLIWQPPLSADNGMEAEAKSTLWPLVNRFLHLFHPSFFIYRSLMILNGWWLDGQRLAVTSGDKVTLTQIISSTPGKKSALMIFSGTEWLSCTAWSRFIHMLILYWTGFDWTMCSCARMRHKKPMYRQRTLQIVLVSLLGHNTGLSPFNGNS